MTQKKLEGELWFRSQFAKGHRDLTPAQLIAVVTMYVRNLNALAKQDPAYAKIASEQFYWPALIRKNPEFDDDSHRAFASTCLKAPRLIPQTTSNRKADFAKKAETFVLDHLKSERIPSGDPCGIIWAPEFFVKSTNAADGSEIRHCALRADGTAEGRLVKVRPVLSVLRVGKKTWVRRDLLRLISDVVICIYGPNTDRVAVYADYLAEFILEVSPSGGGDSVASRRAHEKRHRELFEEIKACLTGVVASVEAGGRAPDTLSIPLLTSEHEIAAVNAVWKYAPLHLGNMPERLLDRRRPTDVQRYDFNQFDRKSARWLEDIQIPLIKAVLNSVPQEGGGMSIASKKGYVDTAKIKATDLIRKKFRQKRGRPKKKSS